jgi:hypothetical protein
LRREREDPLGTLKVIKDARRQLPVNAAAGGGGGNLKVLALLASLVSVLVLVPAAVADPPRDGSGFAVSDDGAGNALYGLGDGFERLKPKAFRFTVPYDVVDVPAELERAKAIITRAKEVGVTDVLVSFRQRHDQWRPETECLENPVKPCDFVRPARVEWRTYVRRFMDTANGVAADGRPKTIDDDVTMWSPANEPNAGTGWLKGDDGRATLAGYFLELREELTSRGSTDQVVSPEFHDHVDAAGKPVRQPDAICPNRDGNPAAVDSCSTVEIYIRKYRQAVQTAAGGAGGETAGFGDWLGWHPIDGARRRKVDSTWDFLDATASTANTPVVVTAAAFVRHPEGIIYPNEPEPSQNGTIKWFANSLVRTPRVKRVYYHNMRQDPSSPSDSGLTRRDESVRPAWRVWCGAAHADNLNHPDCLHSAGLWYVAQSVQGVDWWSYDDDRFDPPTLWAQNHGFGSTDQFLIGTPGLPPTAGAYFEEESCWHLASPAQGYVQPGYPGKFNDPVETACGRGRGSTRRLGGWVTFHNEPDASGRTGRWYRENYAPPYDEWVVGHGHNSTDQFVADVNGGGPDAIAYYHSTGCWHAALTNFQSDRLTPPQEWICGHGTDSARRLMGDVNGDGRMDAVAFRDTVGGQPTGQWDVATSQANRFAAPTQWKNDAYAVGSADQFLADVNGDGKADAIVFSPQSGCWSVAPATPTGRFTGAQSTAATHFGNWRQWICDYGIGATTRMVADVTGDPRADAIAVYTYPTSWAYGGSNHRVDTDAEKEAVKNALIAAGDDEYAYIWRGLSPADQETMDAYIEASDPDPEASATDVHEDDIAVAEPTDNGVGAAAATQSEYICRWKGEQHGKNQRPRPPYVTGADLDRINARAEFKCDYPDIYKKLDLKTCLKKLTVLNDGKISWVKIACDDETFNGVDAGTLIQGVTTGRDCTGGRSVRTYRTYGKLTIYAFNADNITKIKSGYRHSRSVWLKCRAG